MREPIPSFSIRRDARLIGLFPHCAAVKQRLAQALVLWCATPEGRTDARLHYRTSSSCNCGNTSYWTMEASMLDQYGPLPFTARGKPIRWRWWHTLLGNPSFTVTTSDLPPELEPS